MYTAGTIFMLILLELFAADNISRPLVITLITIVLFILVEKDVYLHPDVYGRKIEKNIIDNLDDDLDGDLDGDLDELTDDSNEDLNESGEEEKLWPEEEEKQETDIDDSLSEALKIAESLSTDKSEASEYEDGDDGMEKEVSFVSIFSDDDEYEDEETDDDFVSDNSGRIVVTEIIKNLMYIATAAFGAFVLRDVFAQKYGALYYVVISLSALLCVILRAIYRGYKHLTKEETGTKTALVSYFATSVIFAAFFGCFSVLIGLVYLLGAFIVRMIVPWIFDNWGSGGTAAVSRRKDTVSKVVVRVFALLIILLAVWQLSYGVLWETDFLMIIAVAITSMEPLLKQNLYFEEFEEENAQENEVDG